MVRSGGDETVKIYTSAPEPVSNQIKLEPPSERSSPGPAKMLRNKALASSLPASSSVPVKTETGVNGFAPAGTPEPEVSEPVGRGGKRKLRAGIAAASVSKEREKRSKNPSPAPQASAAAAAAVTTTSSTGSSSEDASGSDNDRSKKTPASFKETKQVLIT